MTNIKAGKILFLCEKVTPAAKKDGKVAYFVRKVKKVTVSLRIPLDNGGIIVYNNMAKLWENYAPKENKKRRNGLTLRKS